ncbi:MAG: hypothetical protein LBJ58_04275 [Tannerellaceae bacterium]|jgi:hypothetical protein|nr:hypothetical protein [Tannerellaceae bacterium]
MEKSGDMLCTGQNVIFFEAFNFVAENNATFFVGLAEEVHFLTKSDFRDVGDVPRKIVNFPWNISGFAAMNY